MAQQRNIHLFHSLLGQTTSSYLLDDYGTGIGAAYSFRKLSSTYTGNCIQLIEDGGDTTAEIGFDGDYINTAAIDAHCKSFDGTPYNGYIVKWYDQSGAFEGGVGCNDGSLIGATTAAQPKIYDATTGLEEKDGFVACNAYKVNPRTPVVCDPGTGGGNGWITGWGNTQDLASFSVVWPITGGYDGWLGCGYYGASNYRGNVGIDTSGTYGTTNGINLRHGCCSYSALNPPGTGSTAITFDTWHVSSAIWRDTSNVAPVSNVTYLNLDGVLQVSMTTYTNAAFSQLAWPGGANAWQPWAGEWLLYQDVPDDAIVADIEANIMDYYSIS